MQRSLSKLTAVAAVAFAAAALCGCGVSGSRPDPTPISTNSTKFVPAPPHLPAHHPAGAVFVLDLTDHATVRPATVDVASNGTLEDMQWSTWGTAVASGHGTEAIRDCNPSCAAGQTVSYPVTVSLSHPTSCFGAHFYAASSIVAETSRGPAHLISYIRNPC